MSDETNEENTTNAPELCMKIHNLCSNSGLDAITVLGVLTAVKLSIHTSVIDKIGNQLTTSQGEH